MKKITRVLIALFFGMFLALPGWSQGDKVEMADVMRENGRIYVVIAVLLTILAGLIIYMVRVDRKLTRIEKNK